MSATMPIPMPGHSSATTRNRRTAAIPATPGEIARGAPRSLAKARGREFRREFDLLLEALARPEARHSVDASVLLEVEAPVDDHFALEAATVLANEITWSDEDQDFADWAIRARERWALALVEFARLEIAALGPGSPLAVRLVAIAMAGLGEAIRWRSIAGRRARDLHALHEAYRIAESAGIAREPAFVQLQGHRTTTTTEALYVRALLFDALCAGALSRRELIVADDWLVQWSGDFRVTSEPPAGNCPVAIGIHGAGGLEPCGRARGAATRFVSGLARLRDRIGEVRASFHEGIIAARARQAAELPIEHHVSALARLEELLAYWANPAAARENRSASEAQPAVDLFVGIGEIVGRAFGPSTTLEPESSEGAAATAVATDSARAERQESFGMVVERIGRRATIIDRSAHGLGLAVPRGIGGPVIGDLVGVRLASGLKIGRVVRRFADPAQDRIRLGVRVLVERPARVALRAAGSGMSRTQADVTALFVPGMDRDGRFDALLVPLATFRAAGPFEMPVEGTTYTLRFVRDLISGRGWVAARFEVLGAKDA